jgi:hypothetical protein
MSKEPEHLLSEPVTILSELVEDIEARHSLISPPFLNDHWQFTQAVDAPTPAGPERKARDLHSILGGT